jgi:hypothetical protein
MSAVVTSMAAISIAKGETSTASIVRMDSISAVGTSLGTTTAVRARELWTRRATILRRALRADVRLNVTSILLARRPAKANAVIVAGRPFVWKAGSATRPNVRTRNVALTPRGFPAVPALWGLDVSRLWASACLYPRAVSPQASLGVMAVAANPASARSSPRVVQRTGTSFVSLPARPTAASIVPLARKIHRVTAWNVATTAE